MNPLHIFLSLCVASFLCSCVEPQGAEPAIHWVSADFDGIPLDRASLAVPFDPDDLDSERLAHIEVYRVKSELPSAPTLVFLQGGPGGDVGELLGYIGPEQSLETLREKYTLYFVNSRGLGEERDEFCTEIEGDVQPSDISGVITQCIEDEVEYLGHLTTRTTAFDLDFLRRTLGLESWSMYGVSYGTAVAAAYAEEFPDYLESIILDGILDPKADLIAEAPKFSLDSIAQLRVDCAAYEECPAEFTEDAMGIIDALMVQADQGWTVAVEDWLGEVSQVEVTQEVFLSSIIGFLSDTDARLTLPQALVDASNGDDSGLSVGLSAGSSPSRGFLVHLIVVCRELWIENLDMELPGEATIFGSLMRDDYDAMCPEVVRLLGQASIPHPVSSPVPALLLSGEGDNRTPPAYGDQVASRFQKSTHAVLRGRSHGVVDSPCGSQLFRTFLADHDSALDLSCAATPPEWPSEDGFDF